MFVLNLQVNDDVLVRQPNNNIHFELLSIHYHYMYFENEFGKLYYEHEVQLYKRLIVIKKINTKVKNTNE